MSFHTFSTILLLAGVMVGCWVAIGGYRISRSGSVKRKLGWVAVACGTITAVGSASLLALGLIVQNVVLWI